MTDLAESFCISVCAVAVVVEPLPVGADDDHAVLVVPVVRLAGHPVRILRRWKLKSHIFSFKDAKKWQNIFWRKSCKQLLFILM